MRVAIETIIWGQRPDDVVKMLEEVKEAGYEGVEIWQHPEVLGPQRRLYQTLAKLGLRLVGIAGGSQVERIKYLRRVVDEENIALALDTRDKLHRVITDKRGRKPYIWVARWEADGAREAAANGFPLALHPHMFTPIQTALEAQNEMTAHPELRFLPDIAHLTVAGENPVEVLDYNFDRLEAVHLKDWTAEYGRAYQFYARGFVELGAGQVPLGRVIDMLTRRGYDGWVVVDQNFSANPGASARMSRAVLRSRYKI